MNTENGTEAKTMKYEVINLDTDESHGEFDSLSEARGCVIYDQLRAYQIWHGDLRVENCEPYDGNDDRVRQAVGQAPWEQPA